MAINLKFISKLAVLPFAVTVPALVVAQEDVIELNTTTIKGNTELPKYMYVVPWQDREQAGLQDQKVKIHDIYGDLFDPVMPEYQAIAPEPKSPEALPGGD